MFRKRSHIKKRCFCCVLLLWTCPLHSILCLPALSWWITDMENQLWNVASASILLLHYISDFLLHYICLKALVDSNFADYSFKYCLWSVTGSTVLECNLSYLYFTSAFPLSTSTPLHCLTAVVTSYPTDYTVSYPSMLHVSQTLHQNQSTAFLN